MKVPAEKTDEFITFAEGLSGKISDLQDAVEDVSLQYTDTETRIKTLREEQKRLMSYMDKTTSVAELKQLEDSIQDVTQRLESAESQMKVMDSRINYTTISIRVTSGETSLTEKSSNLREALKDFFTNLQNSTAVLITVISFLLPFAILAFLIVLLIRFIRKKRRAGQNRAAAAAPQMQNAQMAPASQVQNPLQGPALKAQSSAQTSIHQQWDTPAQNPPANPKDRKPTS